MLIARFPAIINFLNGDTKVKTTRFVTLLLFALLCGCSSQVDISGESLIKADVIFIGDNIITMDAQTPVVEAVAISGQKILATGRAADMLRHKTSDTRVIELDGRALVPGFIDAHGHLAYFAQLINVADLSPPPVGTISSIEDIVRKLKTEIDRTQPAKGTWVVGFGYDDSLLKEKRHPTRDDLDRISTQHPIALTHASGHLMAVNSAALLLNGIDQQTKNPPGGVVRRIPGTKTPNGVMEETAMRLFSNSRAQISPQESHALIHKAIAEYASLGVTTIQEGGISQAGIGMMRAAAEKQIFASDVTAYSWINNIEEAQVELLVPEVSYTNGFRVAGVKIGLDGSPQGRTAFLSEPYTQGPPGADSDYRAYPTYPAVSFNPRIGRLIERGVPTIVHANGDGAIDMVIDGVEQYAIDNDLPDHRTVIIHAQLMRKDQLAKTKSLGLLPSYFSAHTFFWGDWHRLSFGEDRASYISPAADTARMDIPFTIHNDSPVVPPDMMRLMWAAVNRKTRSDFVLGPDQKLTPMQALHAVTLGAAYQYFEEDLKGSITPGKQADLVVLGSNPLTADPDSLKDIPIIETFARGQSIFRE